MANRLLDRVLLKGLNLGVDSTCDDIGHGIDSLVHGATHGVEKTACDVIKAMDIELPGIDEKVPPTNMMGGLVKFKDGEASTGSLKLSDCTVEDGKAVLGFAATAKLSGGDVSVIGKNFDLPEATLPYSVQLTADICTKFSIPTGIKNMGVKSIEIGDAKVGNHELPQEVIEFANGSLNKYGTTAVMGLHTVKRILWHVLNENSLHITQRTKVLKIQA